MLGDAVKLLELTKRKTVGTQPKLISKAHKLKLKVSQAATTMLQLSQNVMRCLSGAQTLTASLL